MTPFDTQQQANSETFSSPFLTLGRKQ